MTFKGTIEFNGEEYDVEIERRVKIVGNVFIVTLFDEELLKTVPSGCITVFEDNRQMSVDFPRPPPNKDFIYLAMSVMDEVQEIIDNGYL